MKKAGKSKEKNSFVLPSWMKPWGAQFQRMVVGLDDDLATQDINGLDRYRLLDKASWDFLIAKYPSFPVEDKVMDVFFGRRWESEYPEVPNLRAPDCCEVFILTNRVTYEEVSTNTFFVGFPRETLNNAFMLGDLDPSGWYVSALCKHLPLDFKNESATLKQAWVKEFYPIVQREISLLHPKVILAFGAEPIKFLLGDTKVKMSDSEGVVYDLKWPTYMEFQRQGVISDLREWNDSLQRPVETFDVRVMSCPHPRTCLRSRSAQDRQKLDTACKQMVQVIKGSLPQEKVEHYAIYTIEEMRELVKRVEVDIDDNLIALDAEWNGDHPQNSDWYVRSIQISWKPNTACAMILHDEEGKPTELFDKYKDEFITLYNKLVSGKQVAGHYFDADLEHIEALGLKGVACYKVPDTWEEYKRVMDSGEPAGFDTALAAHSLEETGNFSLTAQFLLHTTAPRYDLEVSRWMVAYKKACKASKTPLPSGYGPVPDNVLVPYGCYDADVTRRIAVKLKKNLNSDRYGHSCWQPFWRNMRVVPAILRIKEVGILVDKARMFKMMRIYEEALKDNIEKIKRFAGFQAFNPNSLTQLRWFLFGVGEAPEVEENEEAFSMDLQPAYETGDKPRTWDEIVKSQDESSALPSTSQRALSLLYNREGNKQVKYFGADGQIYFDSYKIPISYLRNISAIKKVLQTVLRLPDAVDENDDPVWDKGLPSFICGDSRVRTTIYTTKETGRWSSARPPLQNISKTREVLYKEILGENYPGPLRSVMIADPGYVLVSTDLSGAELTVAALLSGDKTMMDHVQRNRLPEDDPNFYDIHSNIAVSAFKLECKPTKHGLKEAGFSHYRHLAKSVIFGVMYGRGAKAISLAAQEEGVNVTAQEAQDVVNAVFSTYPGLRGLFDECARRVADPKECWLVNAYGRYRRFYPAKSQVAVSSNTREAMNFPVQGFVADAVNTAVANFYYLRNMFGCDYRIVLQIHDEVVVLVREEDLSEYLNVVVPTCMQKKLPLYGAGLDGKRFEDSEPRYFGNESTVYRKWGISLSEEELQKILK